jgi:hypothetical protein
MLLLTLSLLMPLLLHCSSRVVTILFVLSLFSQCYSLNVSTMLTLPLLVHCYSSCIVAPPTLLFLTLFLALFLLHYTSCALFFPHRFSCATAFTSLLSCCISHDAHLVLQLCVTLFTLQLFFHCHSSRATFLALLFFSRCCSLHVAFLAPSHIVPVPISLIFVVLLVLPLLFFSCYHCYFRVVALFCLVNIVFPLPLPCAG